MNPIDLDHNATTPLRADALSAWIEAARTHTANPSSMHAPGQQARRALATARAAVAQAVGVKPAEVVFTSGATESNHLAVSGALALAEHRPLEPGQPVRRRLLLSTLEHPGLIALGQRLQREGTPVTWLPATADGRIDLAAARAAVGEDVALVSVMTANNETGVIQPVAELAAIAHAAGALLHTDATQALGRMALPVDSADLVTLSAHKVGGPRGVGALLVRSRSAWPAVFDGRQERARRGGTENLPGIAGFAAALQAAVADATTERARLAHLRDRLERHLVATLGALVVGAGAPRLPNTSCVRFGSVPAEAVLGRLDRAGVCASSGAACGSGRSEPSHVLLAMGLGEAEASAGVRFSLGHNSSETDIDRAIGVFDGVLRPWLAEAVSA
jgi:cysteine desulfurase